MSMPTDNQDHFPKTIIKEFSLYANDVFLFCNAFLETRPGLARQDIKLSLTHLSFHNCGRWNQRTKVWGKRDIEACLWWDSVSLKFCPSGVNFKLKKKKRKNCHVFKKCLKLLEFRWTFISAQRKGLNSEESLSHCFLKRFCTVAQ